MPMRESGEKNYAMEKVWGGESWGGESLGRRKSGGGRKLTALIPRVWAPAVMFR